MADDNPATATSTNVPRKLLLVGWDAADWQFALPLMEAGGLPALASLVERGVMGNIATLQPPLSPMLWTSIATGKLADKHGILGFLEPDSADPVVGVRPVSSGSRRARALWNILDSSGLVAHVVAWYASHPAEPGRGVTVSNRMFEPHESSRAGTETARPNPPEGSVYPPELLDPLATLVVEPGAIQDSQLREFLPDLDRIDRAADHRPELLVRQLARTASVQSVATAILQNEPWDFLGVYFDGIDVLGHYFMPCHPPRMPGVSERDFLIYGGVMTRVYQWHDMMLARLLQLAGPDATVLLVSDHGFHSGTQRPAVTGEESPFALDAAWHRSLGLFCAAGPGLKRDERVYGASILDVAPTVLTLFGLPVGEDMDGRVMADSFEQPPDIRRIPTWEVGAAGSDADTGLGSAENAAAGSGFPGAATAAISNRAAIQQLVDLGYLDALSDDAGRNIEEAEREARLSLAIVYASTRRPALALPLLESLHAELPGDGRITLQLGQCFYDLGRPADCAAVLETQGSAETENPVLCEILRGCAALAQGEFATARARFLEAERLSPAHAGAAVLHGDACRALKQWDEAEAAYRRALVLDPDHAQAHDGLAAVLLEERRFHEAAHSALDAVGRLHFFPAAHFHLGLALVGMKDFARALQAFEVSLTMSPGQRDAHRWAATLHRQLGNREKAAEHRRAAEALLVSSSREG